MTLKIYWDDLTEKKQKEILELLGENCNWDVYPIVTFEFEEEE